MTPSKISATQQAVNTTGAAAAKAGLITQQQLAKLKDPHNALKQDADIAREAVTNAGSDPDKQKIAQDLRKAVRTHEQKETVMDHDSTAIPTPNRRGHL